MSIASMNPHCGRSKALQVAGRKHEQGMVLIVVMVVLALMFLAGIGVMRAADTGNVISGNFSFQQAAVQASDRAINDALTAVSNQVISGGGNTGVANRYLATRATAVDLRGIPTAIDWAAVPCVDATGVGLADCTTDSGNYRVQYAVERMCAQLPDLSVVDNVTDIRAKCEYEASATALTISTIGIRYRVLIRVRGPRGTESWFEAMVSGAAST